MRALFPKFGRALGDTRTTATTRIIHAGHAQRDVPARRSGYQKRLGIFISRPDALHDERWVMATSHARSRCRWSRRGRQSALELMYISVRRCGRTTVTRAVTLFALLWAEASAFLPNS